MKIFSRVCNAVMQYTLIYIKTKLGIEKLKKLKISNKTA